MIEFWWSNSTNKKKISWVALQKLCKDKELGGLGFKDIEKFNQALLAKQAWRVWKNPESLLARILQHRYFPRYSFLECGIGTRPSYAWRSIQHGRELSSKDWCISLGIVQAQKLGLCVGSSTKFLELHGIDKTPLSIWLYHLRIWLTLCQKDGTWHESDNSLKKKMLGQSSILISMYKHTIPWSEVSREMGVMTPRVVINCLKPYKVCDPLIVSPFLL